MNLRWKCVIAALGVGLFSGSAGAAVYDVDTLADAPDLASGDGLCAASVGCTLRAAIQQANASAPGPHTVMLGNGLHRLTIVGRDEDASATGDLDVTTHVIVQGAGASLTTIDADALDRVFDVFDAAHLELRDVTVTGGEVAAANGGGVRSSGLGLLTFDRVVLTDNHSAGNSCCADSGGAVFTFGPATIRDSRVVGNTALRAGGLALSEGDVLRTSIAGNHSAFGPGGISVAGTLEIVDSTISDNSTTNSGSALELYDFATVRLANSTVSGNTGGFLGAITAITGALVVEYTTVADNQSDLGIAVLGGGSVSLLASVLSNQIAGGGDECSVYDSGTFHSFGANMDSDGSCAGAFDLASGDPRLGPLEDNGGPTLTHLPLAGSPLVDVVGSAAGCFFQDVSPVGTDQRGIGRPQHGGSGTALCDVGAVERVPEPDSVAGALTAGLAIVVLRSRSRHRDRPVSLRHGI